MLRFQQAAGDRSILFRGKAAERHSIPAEGHPYWSNSEFLTGDIVFEDRLYRDLPINIDVCVHRALVQLSAGWISISLAPAEVQSIRLDGHLYTGVGPEDTLPEGFYEVLGDGPDRVYKRVTKQLTTATEADRIYHYYSAQSAWYLRDREGRTTRVRNRYALLRAFPPERRRHIREQLRESSANRADVPFDLWCQAALRAAAL